MGIEPTDRMFFIQPNGFEDRTEHQFRSTSEVIRDDTCIGTPASLTLL